MQHFVEIVLDVIRNESSFREVQITVDRDPATEG
jgi:hypothetical protein